MRERESFSTKKNSIPQSGNTDRGKLHVRLGLLQANGRERERIHMAGVPVRIGALKIFDCV